MKLLSRNHLAKYDWCHRSGGHLSVCGPTQLASYFSSPLNPIISNSMCHYDATKIILFSTSDRPKISANSLKLTDRCYANTLQSKLVAWNVYEKSPLFYSHPATIISLIHFFADDTRTPTPGMSRRRLRRFCWQCRWLDTQASSLVGQEEFQIDREAAAAAAAVAETVEKQVAKLTRSGRTSIFCPPPLHGCFYYTVIYCKRWGLSKGYYLVACSRFY